MGNTVVADGSTGGQIDLSFDPLLGGSNNDMFADGESYTVTVTQSSAAAVQQSMYAVTGGSVSAFSFNGGSPVGSACTKTVGGVTTTGYYQAGAGPFTFTWTAPSTATTVALRVVRASGSNAVFATEMNILCSTCSPAAPTTPVPSGSPTTPAPVSAGEYDADLCTSASEWGIYDTSAPNTKLCWRVVGDELEVALEAPTGNWASFGMSNTQRGMVGLDAYFFLATGTAGTVENRNAAGTTTPTLDNDTPTYRAIQFIAKSPGDTSRQVVFRRPLAASSNGNRISADANVFTLWATGPMSGGTPLQHTAKSFGSSTSLAAVGAVDVTIVKFATGLKQAHGLCMILAWIFLCPTAIIDARAAKGVLTKGGWYRLHRNCQMLAVVLTIAGYFLIRSDKSVLIDENSSDTRRQHQLIGNVVTFLSIFQICLGLLRNIISGANKEGYDKEKHPHGPRRIIFNVLHILTGIALIFLSWNNVMTGTYINCAGDACDEMEGWVKKPVQSVIAAGTYFALIAYILMGILQLAKNKGYVSSETIVDVVGRHVLAAVAALTFAAAVTAITIVYDSNNF
jgi:hypothetical protein